MIIAVSGANGSIGKELTPFLESLGHTILKISSSNVGGIKHTFSYIDLKDNRIPYNVDLFIHLASINADLTEDQIKDEVQITEDILFSLPYLECSNLIFFSTCKVYGDNSFDFNIFDESSPLNPICSYGKAKQLCENLIFSQSSLGKFNSLILRLPPFLNKSKSSNVGKLINLSKTRIPIPSIAQGNNNQRSFICFDNIKIVLAHIIENINIIENNEVYNLSDEGLISLNDLLRIAGAKRVYSLPNFFGKFLISLPVIKNTIVKLYGNFALDNSKLKAEMKIKLKTTSELLPIIIK